MSQRSVIASSSHWRKPIRRLASCSIGSTTGHSVARWQPRKCLRIRWSTSPLETAADESFDMSRGRGRVELYSVPYNLVNEAVEIRSTPTTVEILHKGTRVASHLRSRGRGQAVTNHEHRPKSHQAHLEWTPSRMVQWAQTIGPHTAQLFERMMADKPHPEMGYRGCLGVIRLAGKYSPARMEAAAERALLTGACRYRSIDSILKNSLDRQPLPSSAAPPAAPPPTHDNIRGADYFE